MTDDIELEEIANLYDFDSPNPTGVVPQNVNNKSSKELLKLAIMPDEDEEIIDSQMTLGSDFSNNGSQNNSINAADGEEMEVVDAMPYPELARDPLSEFSAGYYQKCFPGKKCKIYFGEIPVLVDNHFLNRTIPNT